MYCKYTTFYWILKKIFYILFKSDPIVYKINPKGYNYIRSDVKYTCSGIKIIYATFHNVAPSKPVISIVSGSYVIL